jgi:hypothetical protein
MRAALAVALVTAALAACTGDDSPPSEGTPTTSPPPVTSADSYVFTDAAGIEARLTLEGEGAVLTIENDTGDALPPPGVYVFDARDGSRIDWTVVDARTAPDGESQWQVERPPVPEAKHIGLVVMLFGGEDYGAFVPPQPGAAP